jgi:hypothetical protein
MVQVDRQTSSGACTRGDPHGAELRQSPALTLAAK